jgi:hypothetical protein
MMQKHPTFLLLSTVLACIANTSAVDLTAFEALMTRSRSKQDSLGQESKISMNEEDSDGRYLQAPDDKTECWSTENERQPNRYCIFDDTPRENTFLMLSCPDTRDDLSRCHCTIGVGEPEEAPDTPTCLKCGFCTDGTLAYDCRNVADGSCIGMNCRGQCISSLLEPQDLLLKEIISGATTVGLSVSISMLAMVMLF